MHLSPVGALVMGPQCVLYTCRPAGATTATLFFTIYEEVVIHD